MQKHIEKCFKSKLNSTNFESILKIYEKVVSLNCFNELTKIVNKYKAQKKLK